MMFKVEYKVFSIPCDASNNCRRIFTFTYEASVGDLGDLSSSINTYLQKFFAKDNYELLSFVKADEVNE